MASFLLIATFSLLAFTNATAGVNSSASTSISSSDSGSYGLYNGQEVRKVGPRSTANLSSHALEYFDPFDDLTKVNVGSFFSSDNKKKDFYKFTEENIRDSRVIQWYAEWSKMYLESPPATRTFEWEDFMSEVGNHPNFICTLTFGTCTGTPSLHELEREFPGYPQHARRVYFVTQMYTLLQARAKTINEGYGRAQLYLIDHVAEIVHNMQMEPDASKAALCALLHEMIETGISLTLMAIDAISKAVAGIDTSQIPELQKSIDAAANAAKKFGADAPKQIMEQAEAAAKKIPLLEAHAKKIMEISNGIQGGLKFAIGAAKDQDSVPLMIAQALQEQYDERKPQIMDLCQKSGTNESIAQCSKSVREFGIVNDFFSVGQFGGIYRGILGYTRAPKGNPGADYRPNPWDNLYLSAGSDDDALCVRFEGGLQVNTEHNIQELKFGLSNKFTQMRDVLTGAFERYYKGETAAFPGSMSETASIFEDTQWVGFESTLSDMHMLTKWQNHFEFQMAMQVASVMGAHDFSHVVCTSSKDAPEICAKAAQSAPCKKNKGCLRSIVCPEPLNPEIICKAQKWYGSSKPGGHITRFPSAEKWEPLMGNRYQLTQRKVLESVWEYYKAYRNDFNSLEASWGTRSNDIVNRAGGFHLPVCYKEGLDVTDNKFPASCGDWRSSETELFMAASYMGPRGQLFNQNDDFGPGDFITGVLPKVVDSKSSSPLARYLNFCQLHIRWPNKRDKEDPVTLLKMHRGQDAECGMITAQTQSMSEDAANEWFCSNGYGSGAHGVFAREHRHVAVTPVDFRYNHLLRCKKWMGSRVGAAGVTGGESAARVPEAEKGKNGTAVAVGDGIDDGEVPGEEVEKAAQVENSQE